MSGRGKKSKAQIQASKPEPPPFLQRIREQIVANEDADRRDRSDKRRLERPNRSNDVTDSGDNDPTVVKLSDEHLTEAEYKRMKTELETKYKLTDERESKRHNDLDIDLLIQSRRVIKDDKPAATSSQLTSSSDDKRVRGHDNRHRQNSRPTGKEMVSSSDEPATSTSNLKTDKKASGNKKLSYGSSSEEDSDD